MFSTIRSLFSATKNAPASYPRGEEEVEIVIDPVLSAPAGRSVITSQKDTPSQQTSSDEHMPVVVKAPMAKADTVAADEPGLVEHTTDRIASPDEATKTAAPTATPTTKTRAKKRVAQPGGEGASDVKPKKPAARRTGLRAGSFSLHGGDWALPGTSAAPKIKMCKDLDALWDKGVRAESGALIAG